MTPFGWSIAVYFGLATVAAGAAGAACALVAMRRESDRRLRAVLMIAVAAIACGTVALIVDLERPKEFWLILANYNPSSWISRGSRIVGAFGLASVGLLLMVWAGASRQWLIGFALVLGLLAVVLAIYPAFVLGQEVGRPLWQSALLPALFVAGAVHIGLAIAGAPTWLELGGGAVELVLVVAYGISIGFANLLPSSTAVALAIVAALGVWLLPAVIRQSKFEWHRVIAIAVGCIATRAVILYSGQKFV